MRCNAITLKTVLKIVVIIFCATHLTSCHLISSPDVLFGDSAISELKERSDDNSKDDGAQLCQLGRDSTQPDLLPSFSAWWEGEWSLHQERLTHQLAKEMDASADDPNIKAISASLSKAFSLKIKSQQASLSVDGQEQRLATTPLSSNRGVRLVGGQRELMLWCEGHKAFWRSDSGESFPLKFNE